MRLGVQARELFLHPEVTDPETLECKYGEPDEEKYVGPLW